MVKQVMALFALTLMALLSAGCCEPKSYNVTVELNKEMRDSLPSRNIEIHFVAVSDKENERWKAYSLTKYWQPNDVMRESLPTYKMVFDPSKSAPQTLSNRDPIWNQWLSSNATTLYVLALLPGMMADAPGDEDPRRQILSLKKCRWKTNDIRLEVIRTRLVTNTQQLPDPDRD
jgi:hypothetical protein